jgi:predicted dehydrogenase
MQRTGRRSFLKQSLAGAALTLGARWTNTRAAQAVGANDSVRLAVIGLNSQGQHHIRMYRRTAGVRLVAVCDCDETILRRTVDRLSTEGVSVTSYVDVRKLLEDKDVDAVSIVTPNHWHSLMTIWACQAGKDVYVEKPISHSVWEGRKAVEAVAASGRIVQAGTQSRSDVVLHEFVDYLRRGELGKVIRARGFCYKRRASIGKVSGPQPIPSGVNYDLWCGPSPLTPLRRARLHYDWHWIWATGNGDIGNQGPHEMDMCRWFLGYDKLPPRVLSIGGRFGYDDDAQTANTQIAIFDYEPAPIIFEVRGLPQKAGIENMDNYRGIRVGVVIECENGYFAGGAGGGWVYDRDGKRIKQFASTGGDKHIANFIAAVRSRKRTDLNADILEGHLSAALCHIANISYRLGSEMSLTEVRDRVASRDDITEALDRFGAHLQANGVDLTTARPALGPWLALLPGAERFVSQSDYDLGYWANQKLTDSYRPPYVVPAQV